MKPLDVIVLGAGMVGTSCAYHASRQGLSVALVDRRGPGEETSYGNTGIVHGGYLLPFGMPRDLVSILRFGLNTSTALHYHPLALPWLASWLFDHWRWSSDAKREETALVMNPLYAAAVGEHLAMARSVGATGYFRDTGYLKLYRTEDGVSRQQRELSMLDQFNVPYEVLDAAGVHEREPHLKPVYKGAIWSKSSITASNPGALTKAYAQGFAAEGGCVIRGDAMTLRKEGDLWQVETEDGILQARNVVIAMGPWSADLMKRFGYDLPLASKRGYHTHFTPIGNKGLNGPISDQDIGYAMTPMEQGIRITTGIELAPRDAPATPVQMPRAIKAARELLDFGDPVETQPWRGARPSFADSRPVIGWAKKQKGMMLAFGHNHWGFTLGPITGKIVGQMLKGEKPEIDVAPYAAERFA